MKEISYIVPIYNAQSYLVPCIESILAQKSDEIELILVDDGSQDDSGSICDAYGKQDGRVTVIHQANAGVSAARNAGLAVARGRYIRFVDSDDRIEAGDEVSLVQEQCADLITGSAVVLDGNERLLREIRTPRQGRFHKRDILNEMDMPLRRLTLHFIWNHFYKRELIEQGRLRFDPAISMGEDFLFTVSFFKLCTEIAYIPNRIYCYYKRENASLTRVFKPGELERRRIMDQALLSLYESEGMAEDKAQLIRKMMGETARISVLKVLKPLPKGSYRSKIELLKQIFDSEYYELLLEYLASREYRGRVKGVEWLLIRCKLKRSYYCFLKLKHWLH